MSTRSDEIEGLYNSERLRLERMIIRNVGSGNAADVVQDVFARIWEKAKDHIVLTPSYLSRCTRNAAIDQLRIEKRHRTLADRFTPEQYAAPVVTPHQIAEAREDIRRFDDTLRLLPERTRHVFLLNRVHGCTYEEISAALGLSYIMVEREIAKAIVALRSGLK